MADSFRIGVLGGMGPDAGILLQRLILEATPARRDQDHLEVVTYTNPRVPDRTASLKRDGGASYLAAVVASLRLLERAAPDVLAIACCTAHARLPDIRRAVRTPLLDIVDLTKRRLAAARGPVGILATDGTLEAGLFDLAGRPGKTVAPSAARQREVMRAIYAIKRGVPAARAAGRLDRAVAELRRAGCARIVLGCTELSLCCEALRARLGPVFIDPLRLAARALVARAGRRPRPLE